MRTYQTEPKTGKAIEKNSESKKNEMLKGPICKRFQDILQFLFYLVYLRKFKKSASCNCIGRSL